MSPLQPAEILRRALLVFLIFLGNPGVSAQNLVPPEIEYIPIEQVAVEPGLEPIPDDRIDDRIGGVEWTAPRDELAEPPDEGWDLAVVLEVAYDDNIFLSTTAPETDLVVTVTPKIGYIAGRADAEGAYLRAAYQPSLVLYAENSDETRIDHRFEAEGLVRGKKSSLGFKGRIDRLGGATAEIGAAIDRTEYAAELRAAWQPKEKVAIEIAAGVQGSDYDNRLLSDSELSYLEAALRYAYSPKTEVVLAVAGGTVEVDRAPDQDFQRATARLAWKPREKLSIDVEAGIERRDYSTGSDTFPVAEGRVTWLPREGTEVFLAGYLREESSAIFPGQNIEIAGAKVGLAQDIGRQWTARLETGYESNTYKRVSGFGAAARDDAVFFIQPGVEYRVNEHLRLGAFYRYERNDSNAAAFGYDVNRVGIDASYEF